MSEPFVGQISIFGFDFPPLNWQQCLGQIVPISQNTSLFSLIGTSFGGNGTTTFALPNMQGQVAIGQGELTGGSTYVMGENGGSSTVALTRDQSPSHGHNLMASVAAANQTSPAGNVLAKVQVSSNPNDIVGQIYNTNTLDTQLSAQITPVGGGLPHDNLQPFLVLNYCICVRGIMAPRG